MTPEEREARLTAYALNDAGLSAADRQEIEQQLAGDAALRAEVESIRSLATMLTTSLQSEQAAAPAKEFVTLPATPAPARKRSLWRTYALAASVLLALSAVGVTILKPRQTKGLFDGVAEMAPVERQMSAAPQKRSNLKLTVPTSIDGPDMLPGNAPAGQNGQIETEGLRRLSEPARGYPGPAGPMPGDGGAPGGGQASPAGALPGQGGFGGGGFGGGGIGGGGIGGGGFGGGGIGGRGFGGGFGGGGFQGGGQGVGRGMAAPGMPAMPLPGIADHSPEPLSKNGATPMSVAPAQPDFLPGYVNRLPSGVTDPKKYVADLEQKIADIRAHKAPEGEKAPGPATSPVYREQDVRALEAEVQRIKNHPSFNENAYVKVAGQDALSTFGIDVDTASYSMVRKYLAMRQMPPASAVRLEEMVNYFPYQDKAPTGDDPFAVTVEMAVCPWQPKHRLARIGLKAKPIDNSKRPPSNLVFLIDVSGSMNGPTRLPLVKASLKMLVNQLGENDRVAMVVYAGTTGLVLDSTSASNKAVILSALDRLEAGGSTNGSGGIQQAYAVATANLIKNGTNRVILCTDGDWNVGTTSTEELIKMIEAKRETGVFLSVFGFGMGNLRDEMMVQLAGKGNGNYAYIDTLREAHKAMVEQISGTLVTVAKDVKIQVEFNPAVVQSYRLLGYEKRMLAAKDFADDKKDAGEMGAGHVVTALYELVPTVEAPAEPGTELPLRYQPKPVEAKPMEAARVKRPANTDEAFVVKMRHKKPDGDTSTLRELPVKDSTLPYVKASEDFRFAAAVASFSMLLRDSQYKGNASFAAVLDLASAAMSYDPSGYRAEFLEMAKQAKMLSGKP